jgi:hypothetical protein
MTYTHPKESECEKMTYSLQDSQNVSSENINSLFNQYKKEMLYSSQLCSEDFETLSRGLYPLAEIPKSKPSLSEAKEPRSTQASRIEMEI